MERLSLVERRLVHVRRPGHGGGVGRAAVVGRDVGAGLVALAIVALLGACGGAGTADDAGDAGAVSGCDDRVRPRAEVPAATRHRLDAAGIDGVVGDGDVWIVAPQLDRWGELLEPDPDGGGWRAKVAIWVDEGSTAPEVTVVGVGDAGTTPEARAESNVTAEGLPGPLPTTIRVPGPGCYRMEVQGGRGRARATFLAR